jgi:excinuclease ABC subunit A
VELTIPRYQLTVITGVSGSGKSSLAFDTLHAEGSRQYLESLSAKARGMLDSAARPDVDFIRGLSPVIAIAQRTGGNTNPRSTVATLTEIADHARPLWIIAGDRRCLKDSHPVRRRSLDDNLKTLESIPAGTRLMVVAPRRQGPPFRPPRSLRRPRSTWLLPRPRRWHRRHTRRSRWPANGP